MKLDNIEFTIEQSKKPWVIAQLEVLADQLDEISTSPKDERVNDDSIDGQDFWLNFPRNNNWKIEIAKRNLALIETFPELLSLLQVDINFMNGKITEQGYMRKGDLLFLKNRITDKLTLIIKGLCNEQPAEA